MFTYFSNEMTNHGNFSRDPSQKESPFLGELITWSLILGGNYQQKSHVNTHLTLGLNYKDPELGPTDKCGCGSAESKGKVISMPLHPMGFEYGTGAQGL